MLANFQTRGKASTTRTVVEAPLQQRVQTQRREPKQQQQQSYSRNDNSSPVSKHARFRFEDLPSYEQEAIQTKTNKQLQWQRDLAEQVERKRRLKEQEAARKREEDKKERIRLERQLIELQRENEERIRLEKMKKNEENKPASSVRHHKEKVPSSPVHEQYTRPVHEEYTQPAHEQYKEPIHSSRRQEEHVMPQFESSPPTQVIQQHNDNDTRFLAKLEQRHEDALQRQERAFAMSSPERRSMNRPPVDRSFGNQIESRSSVVYMTTDNTTLSPSFTNRPQSEILMDFVKRRDMWG